MVFLGKLLKFIQAQIYFFCGLTFNIFLNSVHFFVVRKAKSFIEQQKCKGQKNVIEF